MPPDQLGPVVAEALRSTDAVVTDVGSVKSRPLAAGRRVGHARALARYVGSHPMAGSERSGPLAASAAPLRRPALGGDSARPPPPRTPSALVEELARRCGAIPVRLTPEEHDRAVARTSHLPHLLAGRSSPGGWPTRPPTTSRCPGRACAT